MKWPEAKLCQFCRFRHGGTPSKAREDFWNGNIPWVSPKDMRPRVIRDTEDHITQKAVDESGALLVPAKSILVVVRSGILVRTVPVALTAVESAFNQDIKSVQVDTEVALPEFVFWFLHSRQKEMLTRGVKLGATVHSIQSGFIESLKIPVPTLREQSRIVEILDQADELRQKRFEADALAARILPALFQKLFGDPATNPKNWPRKKLGEILQSIDSGWSPVCESRQAMLDEWGILKLSAVTTNRYLECHNKALPESFEAQADLEVRPGDLLFTRKNTYELVGACAYVKSTRSKLMLSDTIFRFNLKPSMEVHPLYLWGLLIHPSKRPAIQALAGGSSGSMPNISKGRLETLEIEKPPFELQSAFAEAVSAYDILGDKAGVVRENIEYIFATMLQRAFAGELTAQWREAHLKELVAEMEQQAKILKQLGGRL